ncbi:MAG: ABC transporter permease, partial [Actinobacteria bacterium HGW-Actinobacteria-8]
NTVFLIIILVWIQTGFAMVILSAAIKGVPIEMNEAASLDGANAWQRFWSITVPAIRPTIVVVLTTITIASLKVYDIVRTLTQGRDSTDIVANKMYVLSFVEGRESLGASLAVILFIFVIPIVIYNVRSLNKVKETR